MENNNSIKTDVAFSESAVEDRKEVTILVTKKLLLAMTALFILKFSMGNTTSYTSPALASMSKNESMNFTVDSDQEAWIGSILFIGIIIGGLLVGTLLKLWGVKHSIHLACFILIAGWILIAAAQNIWMIYIGRLLTGICDGICYSGVPLFASEITPPKKRGALTLTAFAGSGVGAFAMYVCGLGLTWRLTAILSMVAPTIAAVSFFFVPESPYSLLQLNKRKEAEKSLMWLRATDQSGVEAELELIESNMDTGDRTKGLNLSLYRDSFHWKPFGISMILAFFQQFSGYTAVVFYTTNIFDSAGSSIKSNVSSLIVGAFIFLGCFIAPQLTDRIGRRIQIMSTSASFMTSFIFLGVYYKLAEVRGPSVVSEEMGWLPLVCLIVSTMSYIMGIAELAWTIMGEILPPETKAVSATVVTVFNGLCGFLVSRFFSTLQTNLGSYETYWLFAGFSLLAIIFVFIFVPETKGKSLQEIQKYFS